MGIKKKEILEITLDHDDLLAYLRAKYNLDRRYALSDKVETIGGECGGVSFNTLYYITFRLIKNVK